MKTRLACCLLAAAVTAASAAPAQDLSRYSDEGLRAELAGIADGSQRQAAGGALEDPLR